MLSLFFADMKSCCLKLKFARMHHCDHVLPECDQWMASSTLFILAVTRQPLVQRKRAEISFSSKPERVFLFFSVRSFSTLLWTPLFVSARKLYESKAEGWTKKMKISKGLSKAFLSVIFYSSWVICTKVVPDW